MTWFVNFVRFLYNSLNPYLSDYYTVGICVLWQLTDVPYSLLLWIGIVAYQAVDDLAQWNILFGYFQKTVVVTCDIWVQCVTPVTFGTTCHVLVKGLSWSLLVMYWVVQVKQELDLYWLCFKWLSCEFTVLRTDLFVFTNLITSLVWRETSWIFKMQAVIIFLPLLFFCLSWCWLCRDYVLARRISYCFEIFVQNSGQWSDYRSWW